MARRYSKTAAQQCRFYEVDNIFDVYGGNLHQRQPFNLKKAIPRTQQGSEKGFYRFSFGGMPPTIPHGDFTRDCLTT